MDPKIYVERKASAQNRIEKAVLILSKKFDLGDNPIEGLNPRGNDHEVIAMQRVEAIANLLEKMAASAESAARVKGK